MKESFVVLSCLVLLAAGAKSSSKKPDEIKAFVESHIQPDVVNAAPSKLLAVEYKKPHLKVELGNELAPKDVRETPEVRYTGEKDAFYTLVMVDPDAPSRKNPALREWNHWLVVNIPGSDVTKGETLTEYVGSGPPKDTGLHRYTFLLYKQPKKIAFHEPLKNKTNGDRGKFSTEAFAKKYELGTPVAGNFFQAQYDDSVPELHKTLH